MIWRYSSGWFHVAVVFHGTSDGQGVKIHVESSSWRIDTLGSTGKTYHNSTGTVVLGRVFVNNEGSNGDFAIDELTFWNRKLSDQEVELLRSV